jgi:hypothetical protein
MVPLLGVWTVGISVMLFVAAIDEAHSEQLLTDPSFSPGTRWYTGLVDNLGVIGWSVAAAAAFAGAAFCRMGARPRASRFLFGGGLVSCVLLADALLHLHDIAMPATFGIPSSIVVLAICTVAGGWLLAHLREFRRTTMHVLFASAAAFAISALVMQAQNPAPGEGWKIVGDGASLLGVLAWATYFVVTTRDLARSTFVDALLSWPPDVTAGLDELAPADSAR